ncbi:MAG: hypothetical protein N0E59_19575 [Candidatus Thiodiazotropha taylori]|nr:hypothetical protein [Candidatus Thiodiazotropha taylori]MCG8097343.1 hypothetical protein [Candidatus Thiodiazotropha endolucinida]MCG8108866.1 hypothetical protein [Candidatus Thiodiazotropha taylori]MCG8112958.1 hypothetical protein [Candidatus Thiodiazotropha taylori]MCW4281202.1 hypothetical protein [Candidatus Thiodiazotropha taylori]
MEPKHVTYEDAVHLLVEMLENSREFTYITDTRTQIIKLKIPGWQGDGFDEAVTMLIVDLMPFLYQSLPFDPRRMSTGAYYALWEGLAEHLLMTVD